MDSKTGEFVLLVVFSVAAIAAGYVSRERGWMREESSRAVHWVTIVLLWSTGAVLSLWNLAPERANLWVLVVVPLCVVLPAYGVLPIAKAMRLPPRRVGVLALAAGTSNSGFTLGAFLCYTLLPTPALLSQQSAAGADLHQLPYNALAYGVLVVMTMSASVVFLLYPLAYKLGDHGKADLPLSRLILRSFLDWKAMMFYASAVGIALAYLRVPFPEVVHDWHLLKVVFYLGAAGAYFGVGMRLHLGELRPHLRVHALLAVIKFVAVPLLAGVLLLAATRSGLVAPPPALMVQALMLLAFMPAAILTVMLSNLFHLDARMASSVWVANTLLFFLIPLPLIIVALRWL